MMKRDIEKDLLNWMKDESRSPLLLRGARQVGKSYIVEKFGKENFSNFVLVNFEQYPEFKDCFKTLNPSQICASLELLTNTRIIAGETLVFLDEIQECPQAIMALRYFKEQMPELHLIGAGSLLEFTLNDPDFRMPVGRVKFLFLRPLSFGEYLEASSNANLRKFINEISLQNKIDNVIHLKLMSLLREYVSIGGMPAVVDEYLRSKSPLKCQDIQTNILLTYRNDFGKYAKRTNHLILEKLFNKAPGFIGQTIKYSKLVEETDSRTIKNNLKNLSDAGLITFIHATSGSGLPLLSHVNEKKSKLLFLDIGLVKRACRLDLELLLNKDLILINDGALAEQLVGQELLAYTRHEDERFLFFWARESLNSSAEIDYLINVDEKILPIEVKSGSTGTLRSLKIFMEEKKSALGIRIAEKEFSIEKNLLNLPFYMIEALPRLVRDFISLEKKPFIF
jgi:predicted AAA+ superfamily ATPase